MRDFLMGVAVADVTIFGFNLVLTPISMRWLPGLFGGSVLEVFLMLGLVCAGLLLTGSLMAPATAGSEALRVQTVARSLSRSLGRVFRSLFTESRAPTIVGSLLYIACDLVITYLAYFLP